ncbi:MAG: GNAT family N-acetyltransferase [Candidatus Cloacimonetes bacterium]|nr:GNAT family N-acetyltransferase [Candidatus Cloacimonadota bacterium]MCF7813135.1 GNAT family N-acetyltransferase [Candidatus Cloacimonadota bacterium]MCF7867583.1 GNAT family N-acetyltransferase [Candidatus Cloacimonadota bacterium]MCF7883142.1 GNAT family N-acetyltransferase [Candidatus Cloacimonadota bacterium]
MVVDFLYKHLDRFRDSKEDINKCLDYVFSTQKSEGGFILLAKEAEQLVGIVVMIQTGMSGYIPENFLVYVAVDSKMRGKGIGGKLIEKAIAETNGDVALHVEYDNPAKRLYERIGFSSKYAEMRYQKKD